MMNLEVYTVLLKRIFDGFNFQIQTFIKYIFENFLENMKNQRNMEETVNLQSKLTFKNNKK